MCVVIEFRITTVCPVYRIETNNENQCSSTPPSFLRIVYSRGKIIARNLIEMYIYIYIRFESYRHDLSRARVYVSIARKQIRLRRHPVHPTRCTLRYTRFRSVRRYDEVVLLPLGRLNKAESAGEARSLIHPHTSDL